MEKQVKIRIRIKMESRTRNQPSKMTLKQTPTAHAKSLATLPSAWMTYSTTELIYSDYKLYQKIIK